MKGGDLIKLAALINRSGMTRREVAEKAGISERHLYRILKGRNPTLRNASQIANVFGLTVQEVFLKGGQ